MGQMRLGNGMEFQDGQADSREHGVRCRRTRHHHGEDGSRMYPPTVAVGILDGRGREIDFGHGESRLTVILPDIGDGARFVDSCMALGGKVPLGTYGSELVSAMARELEREESAPRSPPWNPPWITSRERVIAYSTGASTMTFRTPAWSTCARPTRRPSA